ncbi:MAG TPA: FixH family protein [Kofleriaceae bacterium]|nr:FixH family protein [Kofleriaceae bacterium]
MPSSFLASRAAWLLVLSSLIVAPACGGDDDQSGDDLTYDCEDDQRDEAFIAGMKKVGVGGTEITLVSSTPAPPQRGNNAWVIEVTRAGAPVEGAAMTVESFMPDHRHYAGIDPVITPGATPGQYQVDPVKLWMPGLWEITVETTAPGADAADEVVFKFCIPS